MWLILILKVVLVVKNPPASARDSGSIPGSGRSPGEGNGNPIQYPCLENSMDREPGGLQSMGSQRVGQDWVTEHTYHIPMEVAWRLIILSRK